MSDIYYRAAPSGSVSTAPSPSSLTAAALARSESFTVDNGGLPITKIHLTHGLIPPPDCDEFVRLAEAAAVEKCGGWQTRRHHRAATTDVQADASADLLALTNRTLGGAVVPLLSRLFKVRPSSLEAQDVFVVRYHCAGEDEPHAQKHLDTHKDGSEISFIVLLNEAFTGGGTSFSAVDPPVLVAPEKRGAMVSFCGRQPHAGVAITMGTRYILAGFMRVRGRSDLGSGAESDSCGGSGDECDWDERDLDKCDEEGAIMRNDIAMLFCDCGGASCAESRRRLGAGHWAPWAGEAAAAAGAAGAAAASPARNGDGDGGAAAAAAVVGWLLDQRNETETSMDEK